MSAEGPASPSRFGDAPDLGEWPGPLSPRSYSGKSVYFLVGRCSLLIALCVYAGLHAGPVLFALAGAALAVDVAHTVLQALIQIRGLALQRWVRRLLVADLDYHVPMPGKDEIAMYARVLEALRQSMLRARALERTERELMAELREKNDRLASTLDQLRLTQDRIVSQQKLAELGELSAGVAHEIRNPLQFVRNFADSSTELLSELVELVRGHVASEASARAELDELVSDLSQNMARITAHSDRANRIVSDMLGLRSGGPRHFERVDLNALVVEQAMLAYHASCARTPGFSPHVRRALDPHAGSVNAVPADLGRVVINLVSNAYQAITEKHAQGACFDPEIVLRTERTGTGVEIAVRDNGVGMTPQVMERIFTPFFTTKSGAEGTGLGLSLSHDIVRVHGGTIEPASVPGEWTEMRVVLPHEPPHDSDG